MKCFSKKRFFRGYLSVVLLICIVSGCSTMQAYDGPKLPENEVSIIKPFSPGIAITHMMTKTHPLSIEQIDGKPTKMFSDKISIKPGEHTLKITFPNASRHAGVRTISLIAEAGHFYMVYGTRDFYEASVWIVDETTGEEVARVDK